MEVGTATAANAATAKTASDQASKKAMLDYDNFLQLLIAQMRNQDPTQPMDATEQIAQLATFSQVEQTIQTNQRLEMLLQSSALSEADAVIGRTVTSLDGKISGVVLADHVKNLDWQARRLAFETKAPADVVTDVRERLRVLLGL